MPHRFALLAFLALTACHGESSSSPASPVASLHDTGLAIGGWIGEGDRWFILVSESDQGRDLDGDGDLLDAVIQTLDLATGLTTNTGLVLGTSSFRGEVAPSPLFGFGSDFAIGASEIQMGRDLNGDGDVFDDVLTRVEPKGGVVTNLGVAVHDLKSSQRFCAFDVSESGQGLDLDGDQVIDPNVIIPFLHDRVTGVTSSSGLSGVRTLGIDDEFLAVAEFEASVGDRNGDGDTDDQVLAFYDLETRTLTSAGLVLRHFHGVTSVPIPHRGAWAVHAVGSGGENELVVYDPRSAHRRSFPGLEILPIAGVAPFVFYESMDGFVVPWLYDADTDELVRVDWSAAGIQALGDQLVLDVSEEHQAADLDGNGELTGIVPVIYDPVSRQARSTGVDGFPVGFTQNLLILADELHSHRDWNGDGDLEDVVLQVFDPVRGLADNTRIATRSVATIGRRFVLFLRSEGDAEVDLNGDGDFADDVCHLYDIETRRVDNLRFASGFLFGLETLGPRGILPVSEPAQGADLNGDGDRVDVVLFLVELGQPH